MTAHQPSNPLTVDAPALVTQLGVVQLPISLPLLSVEQAEAYIALLLCRNAGTLTGPELADVIAACNQRRRAGTAHM
ncbi:hypothetical protein [Rhizocola hellebori]|uniref:hypothetical protein n=1 Tax=Rhizocola hellebori TaxID=1392758 RepID=UPI0019429F3E|nr:hypothetical protein [Rhizocola hellebori]